MKKRLLFAVMAAMTIGLVGCGETSNTTDSVSETVLEETDGSEETTEITDSTETESEEVSEIATDAALPEVKGVSRNFSYELVGMEMTKAYGGDEDILRLWFMVTNDGDSASTPDDIVTRDSLVAYQGETKLNGTMSEDNPLEEQVIIQQILPGTTVLCAENVKLVDNQIVKLTMTDDSNTFEFEVDPANFTEVLPEPFTWTALEDTSFFKPESDSCEDRGVEFKINTIEMMDGKDWMNRNDCKVVRIVLDATSNSDKELMITNPFIPFQDGVELKLGNPMEEDENVDILINAKIAPGETRQIAQTYVLYNETSPVIAMMNKSGSVYGTVYNLK